MGRVIPIQGIFKGRERTMMLKKLCLVMKRRRTKRMFDIFDLLNSNNMLMLFYNSQRVFITI